MENVWQKPLPDIYNQLSEPSYASASKPQRRPLGKRLVILGHHYQQDAVIDFADFTGDSFELSRKAADQTNAEFVVFCGVHFMAESADILTRPEVRVILPDLAPAAPWPTWPISIRPSTAGHSSRKPAPIS